MRSSKNRSRSNKGNRNRSPVGNVVNRVFDSSGPEGKVRGTPQQIIDKYNQLTRDAQLSNDRVAAENFQQHAEHYTRMLSEAQREQEAKRVEQEAQQMQARANRQAREDEHRAQSQVAVETPQSPQVPGTEAQPEIAAQPQETAGQKSFDAVIDAPGNAASGLVETPENTPKPKRARTRRPAKRAEPKVETPAADGDGSQAAE